MEKPYKIFAISCSQKLGHAIANDLGKELGKLHTETFSDGEKFVNFEESVRGHIVFLVAQINMPYENVFEVFLAIDAARRASAEQVVCILPYLPHSRQERKGVLRTAIASRLVADMLQQSGLDRVITIDLHSGSIEGFFKVPVDHLFMSQIFTKHIRSLKIDNLCLCSPDFGGLKRIKIYKEKFNCDMAVIHKERLKPNQVSHMEIIGDVSGKNVVLIDDIIDTAGTICKAADLIMEHGAISVQAYCTHAILSNDALAKIKASALKKVYVSDTVSYAYDCAHDMEKIEVVSCSKMVALAIENLLSNQSFQKITEDKL